MGLENIRLKEKAGKNENSIFNRFTEIPQNKINNSMIFF